jgi:hypothetical protein
MMCAPRPAARGGEALRALQAAMGDGGADFPPVRLRDAQLRQRQGRARTVGVPVTRWRGWERGQRHEIVTPVERGVRADKANRLAHRGTDTAAFDDHIVFEPAYKPDAGRVLNDDEAQASMCGRRRGRSFQIGRPRAIVYMEAASCVHGNQDSNPGDRRRPRASVASRRTYDFDGSGRVGFRDEKITQGD